jgi:hypothetical protein
MKISKIALLTAIFAIIALAPLTQRAHAEIGSTKWLNTAYSGTDPFYQTDVSAYQTGTTATLNVPVSYSNPYGGAYINVTGAMLRMSWNGNYTAAGLSPATPMRINLNSQQMVTITFQVPQTTTVSNLQTYTISSLTVNYTTPASAGTKQFSSFFIFSPFAIYSPDQASAISIMQQMGFLPIGGFGVSTLCGAFGSQAFKTAQGHVLCQQALQQANLGIQQYDAGNFATANSDMKTAQSDYNQAIQADSSQGGMLDVSATLSGWGTLLLGIGGAVVGVAAIMYAIKRTRELRPSTGTAAHP